MFGKFYVLWSKDYLIRTLWQAVYHTNHISWQEIFKNSRELYQHWSWNSLEFCLLWGVQTLHYGICNFVMPHVILLFLQVKLMESLLTTEKHMHVQTPVNCYRKYLGKCPKIFKWVTELILSIQTDYLNTYHWYINTKIKDVPPTCNNRLTHIHNSCSTAVYWNLFFISDLGHKTSRLILWSGDCWSC